MSTELDAKAQPWIKRPSVLFPLIFLAVAVIGLYIVKWEPYYAKAFVAAAKHSIGGSIITGPAATAPEPSLQAAIGYATSYFLSVWKAVILGLLVGSLVQVLIPRKWVTSFFGKDDAASSVRAGVMALPGMMCTCCAAPVAAGLRARSASVGSALAFFLGNPVLNPATIIFMGFVLSWQFAFFRIAAGIILVFGIALLANRIAGKDAVVGDAVLEMEDKQEAVDPWFKRWMKALWQLIVDTIPAYLIVVFILGAVRAWLFPAISPEWGNSLPIIIGLALSGTLFVVPTAAEIPIIQSMMMLGLATGPAAALLMTLPAVSLPSLLIVRRAFPAKVLVFVYCAVAAIGIISGIVAPFVL